MMQWMNNVQEHSR